MKMKNNTNYKTCTKNRIFKKFLVLFAKLRKMFKLFKVHFKTKFTTSYNPSYLSNPSNSINTWIIPSSKRFFSSSSRVLVSNVDTNHVYSHNKLKKVSTIYIKYLELLMDIKELNDLGKFSLLDKISNLRLVPNQEYIVLIKISYGETSHLTLGPQFTFIFGEKEGIDFKQAYSNLLDTITQRFYVISEKYQFELDFSVELAINFFSLFRTSKIPRLTSQYDNTKR